MENKTDLLSEGLQVDYNSLPVLKESAQWAKFISISGMIFAGIALVFSFTMGGRVESALNEGFMRSGTAGYLAVLGILIFAVAFFVLSNYLYRFANRMLIAIQSADKYEFVEAMKQLRNTYRILAILFSIYFLLFLGTLFANLIN
ncbi:MAG: hypothetical protein EOO06_02325 [Chitinophagaceae bacterium]|nr:MAG: hypothetical protein EOO06_02325 [Chitinophagaceae bacterium]